MQSRVLQLPSDTQWDLEEPCHSICLLCWAEAGNSQPLCAWIAVNSAHQTIQCNTSCGPWWCVSSWLSCGTLHMLPLPSKLVEPKCKLTHACLLEGRFPQVRSLCCIWYRCHLHGRSGHGTSSPCLFSPCLCIYTLVVTSALSRSWDGHSTLIS